MNLLFCLPGINGMFQSPKIQSNIFVWHVQLRKPLLIAIVSH